MPTQRDERSAGKCYKNGAIVPTFSGYHRSLRWYFEAPARRASKAHPYGQNRKFERGRSSGRFTLHTPNSPLPLVKRALA